MNRIATVEGAMRYVSELEALNFALILGPKGKNGFLLRARRSKDRLLVLVVARVAGAAMLVVELLLLRARQGTALMAGASIKAVQKELVEPCFEEEILSTFVHLESVPRRPILEERLARRD